MRGMKRSTFQRLGQLSQPLQFICRVQCKVQCTLQWTMQCSVQCTVTVCSSLQFSVKFIVEEEGRAVFLKAWPSHFDISVKQGLQQSVQYCKQYRVKLVVQDSLQYSVQYIVHNSSATILEGERKDLSGNQTISASKFCVCFYFNVRYSVLQCVQCSVQYSVQ